MAQPPNRDLRIDAVVQRQALVIGNEKYAKWPLKNPVNDARSIDQALRDSGFRTDLVLNATLRDIERAVDRFIGMLRPGDTALFYYSGHGIQLSGENYLVPIDFDAKDEADAKYVSYAVSRVQERIEQTGARLNLLILDACRTNPFRTSRAAGGGLAAMNTGRGTFIAFATGPGKVADDNPAGANGLFTSHVVAALHEPGLTLDAVFNRVRERVYTESQQQQLPWTVSSVIGEFRFREGTAPAQGAAPAPQTAPAQETSSIAGITSSAIMLAAPGSSPRNTAAEPSGNPLAHGNPAPASPAPERANPDALSSESADAFRRGDYAHAISLAQDALRLRPNDKRALLTLAQSQFETGQFALFESTAVDAIRKGVEFRLKLMHHHILTGGHPATLRWSASEIAFDPMGARDCNQKAFTDPLSSLVSAQRIIDNKNGVFLTVKITDAQGKARTLNFADGASTIDRSSGLPVLVAPPRAAAGLQALAAVLNAVKPK